MSESDHSMNWMTLLSEKELARLRDRGTSVEAEAYGVLEGYRRFGWIDADYRLGLAITNPLAADGGPSYETEHGMVCPWFDRALYNLALGNLKDAEEQLRALNLRLNQDDQAKGQRSFAWKRAPVLESLATALIARGLLAEARAFVEIVLEQCSTSFRMMELVSHHRPASNPYGISGLVLFMLGDCSAADSAFLQAYEINVEDMEEYPPLFREGIHEAWHAILLIQTGRLNAAEKILTKRPRTSLREMPPLMRANFQLAWAEYHLARSQSFEAEEAAESARSWSAERGHVDVRCRSLILLSRIALRRRSLEAAGTFLAEALKLATECGFTLWRSDALVLMGHHRLELDEPKFALDCTEDALAICNDPTCGYAWCEGTALHLRACAQRFSGNLERARESAKRARDIRKRIGDARLANTKSLLLQLGESANGIS